MIKNGEKTLTKEEEIKIKAFLNNCSCAQCFIEAFTHCECTDDNCERPRHGIWNENIRIGERTNDEL